MWYARNAMKLPALCSLLHTFFVVALGNTVVDNDDLGVPSRLSSETGSSTSNNDAAILLCILTAPVPLCAYVNMFFAPYALLLLIAMTTTYSNTISFGGNCCLSIQIEVQTGLTKTWRADGSDDGPERKWPVGVAAGQLELTGRRIPCKKGQRQRPRAERTIRPLKWQFNFCLSVVNRTFYAVFRNVCIWW